MNADLTVDHILAEAEARLRAQTEACDLADGGVACRVLGAAADVLGATRAALVGAVSEPGKQGAVDGTPIAAHQDAPAVSPAPNP